MRFHPALNTRSMRALTFGLTLVRHGETHFNKQGLLQGQTIDAPLSDVGLQQADAAGRYLRDVRFTNVFVSDMMRARQTAEAIVKHNSSCLGLQMVSDPLLKEKSFGIAEGKPVKEMKAMAEAAGEPFRDFTPPEGETPLQVKERVKTFLEKMLLQIGTEHADTSGREETTAAEPPPPPAEGKADDGLEGVPVHALVVTHGSYMTVAVRYFVDELRCSLPRDCDKAHMLSLSPNTGLCRFTLTVRKEGDRFMLSGMHCVFAHRRDHLKE